MNKYPTPHINAEPKDFAKTVIMPGDPLRAKMIAEKYLTDYTLVNDVRCAYAYTGKYKGVPVTVMASGMGMPSAAIYSYELYNIFGVENIIRTGSAGSMQKDVKLRDVVIAMGACTTSSYANTFNLPGTFAPVCSPELLLKCLQSAKELGINAKVGNVLTSDAFYCDSENTNELSATERFGKMGVLAVEMETAAIYMNAARYNKNAITICTISDSVVTGEATTAEERQNSFCEMIELALNTAVLCR